MFLTREFLSRGHTVHIITPKNRYITNPDFSIKAPGNVSRVSFMMHSLTKRWNTRMFNIPGGIWYRFFRMIDSREGWIIPSLIKAIEIIDSGDVQVIIASGPPFSGFVSAAITAKITGLPLVLDYRDPWSNNTGTSYPLMTGRAGAGMMERLILRTASAAVFCSDRMKISFQDLFGYFIPHSALRTITNGITGLPEHSAPKPPLANTKTILYAGSFYRGRSINPIASALQKYSVQHKPLIMKVLGPNLLSSEHMQFTELAPDVELVELGWLDYDRAKQEIGSADVLYLSSVQQHSYAIPYKFFDYLQSGVPILAVSPRESAVYDIVEETGCGKCIPADEPDEIEKSLFRLLSGNIVDSVFNAEDYCWSNLALKYLNLLNSITVE